MDFELKQIIEFLGEQNISSVQEIQKRLKYTRRQIEYRVEKINDKIAESNSTERILLDSKGYIFISSNCKKVIRKLLSNKSLDVNYSQEERQAYIYFSIFGRNSIIGMADLMINLNISKSTLINDLKELKKVLYLNKIEIGNTKNQGYFLVGSEDDKRYQFLLFLNQIYLSSKIDFLLKKILADYKLAVIERDYLIEKLQQFNIRFVSNRTNQFYFVLNLILNRINKQNNEFLPEKLIQYTEELREYKLAVELTKEYSVSKSDLAYLSAWLLSISVATFSENNSDRILISSMVNTFINRFLVLSGLDGMPTTDLFEKVYAHFRAAFYRVSFNIPIGNPYLERIKQEYPDLLVFVEQALKPIESKLNINFNSDEIAFLAIHFAGIYTEDNVVVSTYKALVICDNGVGISTIMYNELSKLFDNIEFYPPMSFAEFQIFNAPFDYIFTNKINSDFSEYPVPVYRINPIMTEVEKLQLKTKVNHQLNPDKDVLTRVDLLLSIAKKYSHVENELLLKEALLEYCMDDISQVKFESSVSEIHLKDMISPKMIRVKERAENWQEAVSKAAQLLVEEKVVEPSYFMKLLVADNVARFVIMPGIALPHATPETDVNKYGISIVTLSDPISFGENKDPISIILCLAAKEDRKHIAAMKELVELLQKPNFVERINELNSSEQLYHYLVGDLETK